MSFIAVSDFLFPGEELEMEYEDKGRGTWLCRIKYGKFTASVIFFNSAGVGAECVQPADFALGFIVFININGMTNCHWLNVYLAIGL